jgi:HEAT repeat protein
MEQTQTPVPIVERAQARALSRGVLAPLAYATAALALAALPEGTDLRWLSGFTLALSAAIVLTIALALRRAYVSALRRAIDDRHLHLDAPVDDAAVGDLDAQAAFLVAKDLAGEDEGRALLAAELLAATHRPLAALLLPRGLDHASAAVRAATVEGLARSGAGGTEAIARLLGDDPAPDVRLAAARALTATKNPGTETRARLASAMDDEDPRVRAAARVALALADDPAGAARGAALVPCLRDRDPIVRRAALDAVGPAAVAEPAVLDALRELLAAEDLGLRLAALETAGRVRARALLADVGPLLADARTTEGAIAHLVRWGRGALDLAAASVRHAAGGAIDEEPLAHLLAHDDPTVRERTTLALSRIAGAGEEAVLPLRVVEPLLEREARTGYRWLSLLAGVAHDDGTPDWEIAPAFAFLGRELDLRFRASRARVLGLLSLFASRHLTNSVEAGMRRPAPGRMEAQVAELLETALPARLARTVVPLFDRLTLKERIREAQRVELFDQRAMDDPLGWIVAQGDRTLRVCAMLTYGDRAREQHPDIHAEDRPLIPLFERMRFLRSVPLFDALLGDDLRSVAEIVESVDLVAGATVFAKGEPGEDMYVIVSGRIAIQDGAREIASLGSREFFGELSVIDREARSASAVAVEATQLLRLRAADLGELMARRPRIQEEILLVVVRRLRALNARVAQ